MLFRQLGEGGLLNLLVVTKKTVSAEKTSLIMKPSTVSADTSNSPMAGLLGFDMQRMLLNSCEGIGANRLPSDESCLYTSW